VERARDKPPPDDDAGATSLQFSVRAASGRSCLYCREAFAESEKILVCEGCDAGYHRDCLSQELGRCATLGCAGQRALPRRARTEGDYANERLLRECFAKRLDCELAPLEPRLWERARVCFAKGLTPEETPLVVVINPRTGAPLALFSDRAAHLDLRELGDDTRLAYADLKRVTHEAGASRVITEGGGQRVIVPRRAPQAALRRFFDRLLEQPWQRGRGFACDACLEDFEPNAKLVECAACGACHHPGCVGESGCCTPDCAAGQARSRLAADLTYSLGPAPREPEVNPDQCRKCSRMFEGGDRTLTCEGCGAAYHPGCLLELGCCATRGCQGKRALPGRRPASLMPWALLFLFLFLLLLGALSAA
jgi:hypothetical protein